MADDASAPLAAPAVPVRHRFTGADVLRMIEAGILSEKARVVLRGGELIDMPAEGSLHFNVKSDLIQAISVQAFGRYRVGADGPLRLSDQEWPEPDLFLIPKALRPAEALGPDTLLVIEVADSSLAEDLGANATLYAAHGVREYWVVDLPNQRLHVHRLGLDGVYPEPQIVKADDTATAGLAPEITLRLLDVL